MQSDKVEMCKSLIEWFKTLNLKAQHSTAEEICDGVALAEALNQFAPESFTDTWHSKIRSDVGSNWRLKSSNLKKVIEGVYDYYTDVLSYTLSNYARPDAIRIAEKCDMIELERLLQLILGCAVNCAEKQSYIKQIMCLEESLQQNIMNALQDLESTWQGGSPSRNSLSIANFDSKIVQEERDSLAQKCFEAEKKISLLIEEKTNLQQEITKLQNELERIEVSGSNIGEDGISLGPMQAGSARYNEMRRQVELLKDDILQSETAREDLKIKAQLQEKELAMQQQRIEELTQNTIELAQLKDDVDILRESNDKLRVYETQCNVYKKKLEDFNDMKKQIKILEDRAADYMQQNTQFEEDAKKYATAKGQIELFKKEIQELHTKLDSEMSKNVKLEFDNKNLESNVNALQRAKDSLLKERDNLRENIDELKCGQPTGRDNANTMSKELHPSGLVEKIELLKVENKALREGQGGQTALAQLLDDANKRNENMREQLKSANERILTLTQVSQSNDPNFKDLELSKQLKHLIEVNEQKALHIEESLTQNANLQTKIAQLESTLATREQELIAYETKYRKYMERAKEVIKTMDPRIEQDLEIKPVMGLIEEQAMATAFYNYGLNTQRDAVDTKLALLMGGQGHTFLSRQRQSAPRKSNAQSFKQK